MTHAYDESYLDSVMNNIGDMLDYAVNDCGYDADDFFNLFILSGVSAEIEAGNPKFLAGLSGPELFNEILLRTKQPEPSIAPAQSLEKSSAYWAGWILSWYQWHSGKRFSTLAGDGLSISKVLSLYPTLHEADESKFAEIADGLLQRSSVCRDTQLKRIRRARGFSQKELAHASGVSLRAIQLYEQRQNDVNKAQASTLLSLAKALGCNVEDLME